VPTTHANESEEALRRALTDLYRCPSEAEHIWCVFDRASGERHLRQVRDIIGEPVAAALTAMRQLIGEESSEAFRSKASKAIELLADLPWGDVDVDLRAMERALRLALEATAEDLSWWERHQDGVEWEDEFSVLSEAVEAMTPERRLAYVARLIATVALCYGVEARFGHGPLVGDEDHHSPAALMRGLNDIFAWGVAPSIGSEGSSEPGG